MRNTFIFLLKGLSMNSEHFAWGSPMVNAEKMRQTCWYEVITPGVVEFRSTPAFRAFLGYNFHPCPFLSSCYIILGRSSLISLPIYYEGKTYTKAPSWPNAMETLRPKRQKVTIACEPCRSRKVRHQPPKENSNDSS